MKIIKIIGGPFRGKEFQLIEGSYSIGRDASCQIQLDSKIVSRLHSTLLVDEKNVTIKNHSTSNGTVVNGSKVDETKLINGDKIYIGDNILAFFDERSLDVREDFSKKEKTSGKKKIAPPDVAVLKTRINSFIHSGDWKLKTLLSVFILPLLSGMIVIGLINSKIDGDLQTLALIKGKELARYMAEKNKLDLIEGNEMLLDTKVATDEKWVLKASILSENGTILAPSGNSRQIDEDPFVREALNSESDRTVISTAQKIKLSIGGSSGIYRAYILAHPIRYLKPGADRYKTVGAAKILFVPRIFLEDLPSKGKVSYFFLFPLLAASLALYLFLKFITITPVKSLMERVEQSRIDGSFDNEGYPKEFKELASSIKRLVTMLATMKANDQQNIPSITTPPSIEAILSDEKIESILAAVPQPTIVFDLEKTILAINEQALSFFNLNNVNCVGKKIFDITDEREFKDAFEEIIEDAEESTERLTNKTYELNLRTYQLSLASLKDRSGKIEFGTLTIEKI